MTIAVGCITEAQQAEDILRSEQAALVALARELLWNADWTAHAAEELGYTDPFAVMPEEHAHRLRQRAAHKKLPRNQGGTETQAAKPFLLGKGNRLRLKSLATTMSVSTILWLSKLAVTENSVVPGNTFSGFSVGTSRSCATAPLPGSGSRSRTAPGGSSS